MDLSDLKDTVSNLTLYDLKAGFRKAQNGTCSRKRTTTPMKLAGANPSSQR
jgi:hypothetical protein